MKYLAILKDSVREAIDTKVFYVTVGLSTLLILTVAGVGYRPISAEEEIKQATGRLNWIFGLAAHGKGPHYEILDFRRLNAGTEPWLGDYQFAVEARFSDAGDVAFARTNHMLLDRNGLEQMLKQQQYWIATLNVTEVKTNDPKVFRYEVATHGTKITDPRDWIHEPTLFSVGVPLLRSSLTGSVYWLEDALVNRYGAWAGILTAVVITAFFIPNMLRKGTVDLLIARPIHRSTLLLYKYVGGLTFVFLNAAYVVLGLWLAIGLRSGIWAGGFLLTVFVMTFFFAVLYAVSTWVGVLTQSPVLSILVTVIVWFALFALGTAYQTMDAYDRNPGQFTGAAGENGPGEEQEQVDIKLAGGPIHDRWWFKAIQAAHFVLPRTHDLDVLTTRLLSHQLLSEAEIQHRGLDKQPPMTWAESLTISGAFIAILLALSCWRFAVRDY